MIRADFRSPLYRTRLVQPETLLPVQLYDSRQRPLTPEKRLVIAILADALNCIQRYYATRGRRRRLRSGCEAEHWLMSEDRQWPFSFENICDLLSIDSQEVRYALHNLSKQHDTPNVQAAVNGDEIGRETARAQGQRVTEPGPVR